MNCCPLAEACSHLAEHIMSRRRDDEMSIYLIKWLEWIAEDPQLRAQAQACITENGDLCHLALGSIHGGTSGTNRLARPFQP